MVSCDLSPQWLGRQGARTSLAMGVFCSHFWGPGSREKRKWDVTINIKAYSSDLLPTSRPHCQRFHCLLKQIRCVASILNSHVWGSRELGGSLIPFWLNMNLKHIASDNSLLPALFHQLCLTKPQWFELWGSGTCFFIITGFLRIKYFLDSSQFDPCDASLAMIV